MVLNENQIVILTLLASGFLIFIVAVNLLDKGNINGIKAKTVGDGQHGTARWATKAEIRRTFSSLPFEPQKWRKEKTYRRYRELLSGAEEMLIQQHLWIPAMSIR